jgi:acyl-CoA synthetase (AMP-forming)/AMP-acid ligase II
VSECRIDLRAVAPPPRSPVPRTILDQAETLTGTLATLVDRFSDFPCLTLLDGKRTERRLSLAELWVRARAVQATLAGRGVGPGDFVLLVLPTGAELVSAYFGVLLAGGVPGLVATPSNRVADPSVYGARVRAILDNAGPRVLYATADVARLLADAGVLEATAVITPGDVVPGAAGPPQPGTPDGIATVQYSSGSTGTPKGILLTHRAMLNNIRAVRDGLELTAADVSVNWIPLYHDMGLIDAFLLPLLSGNPTVLIPTMDFMREPALWLWAMHHYRGTFSWAPNFAYTVCARRVRDAELAGLDLGSWRIAINAAEPVLAGTIEAFETRFAPHGFRPGAMTPAWGLAENVTIATAHPVGAPPLVERLDRSLLATAGVARPGEEHGVASVAIGCCLPACEIEIRDPAGRLLPDRHVGTVWLRTNSLFAAYRGDPAQTRRALVDGWLDTGDRGYLADGNLYFVARDKDLVVVGGEKYAPHDLETVINRVPGVREGCAVVFGVPNEDRGTEDIGAVVEVRESDADALPALREAIRVAVARAIGLGLRYVILVPPGGVEKTTSGKLARGATRARYADQLRG